MVFMFWEWEGNHTTLGEKIAGQKTKEDNSVEWPDWTLGTVMIDIQLNSVVLYY